MPHLRPDSQTTYATTGAFGGTLLALGRCLGAVEVRSIHTGALTHARQLFAPGDEKASALAFSPEGGSLAALGSEGLLIVWNLAADTIESHHVGRRGGTPSLAFSDDGLALSLFVAGDEWKEERVPDGPLRMWAEPASDTLVVRVRNSQVTRRLVDGRWLPLPGSPDLMHCVDGDQQRVEAWRVDDSSVHREHVATMPLSERIEALSPSGRWALIRTTEGRRMVDRELRTSAPLADTWSGDVLGFVDEGTCLVFERGPMRLTCDGMCSRVRESEPQSAVLAATRDFVLERSGFERECLISMDGSARTLSTSVAARVLTHLHEGALEVLSYTPGQPRGVFVHFGPGQRELERSRVSLFDLAVSAEASIAVGIDAHGAVHRWRLEDGAHLGDGALFGTEAERGCLPTLAIDPTGVFAVERNRVMRLFDLVTFREVGRFAHQKHRGDPPDDDPSAILDRKAERKLEAAWDSFFALREPLAQLVVLSAAASHVSWVEEDAVLVLPREGRRKRYAMPRDATSVAWGCDGKHLAVATDDGVVLFSSSPHERVAAWSRAEAGRVAATDGQWVVMTRGSTVEVCEACTGEVRWSCQVPSFDHPEAPEVQVYGGGTRLLFVRGSRVVCVAQEGRGGRVVLEIVVLPGGELLATGEGAWWATPGAFAHAYLASDGRAVSTLADARGLLGEPSTSVLASAFAAGRSG